MIKYNAFTFRQNDNGPVIVSFIANSCSIDEWAKVPTRLSNKVRQFQRSASPKHIDEIKEFFKADETKTNSSPTAILLGVEPKQVANVKLLNLNGEHLLYQDVTKTPQQCVIEIDFDPWDSSSYDGDFDSEISALFQLVKNLYISNEDNEDEDDGVSDADAANDNEQITTSSDDEDGVEDELENDETNDQAQDNESEINEIKKYFSEVTPAELTDICNTRSFTTWSNQKKNYLIGIFKDDLKPCLIIDGQHRIKGTVGLTPKPFLVSMLPDASWGELTFQFIVNNTSAKPVDENILFGIVGESLSQEDLQKTEVRLNRSGIKVSLIKAAMRVQLEPNPFTRMLKTNTLGEPGFIDATALKKKVIELWYGSRAKSGKPNFKKFKTTKDNREWSMRDLFGQLCSGSNDNERALNWQNDLWFKYFSAFWQAISEHFQPRLWPQTKNDWPPNRTGGGTTALQEEKLKLMSATKLGLLQRATLHAWADFKLKELRRGQKDFSDYKASPEQFKIEIKQTIEPMTTDFFLDITYTGFDASASLREEMLGYMMQILNGNKTMADFKGKVKFWQ